MSLRQRYSQIRLRAKWHVMDMIIAVKERSPFDRQIIEKQFGYVLVAPSILIVSFLALGIGLLAWYSILTFDTIDIFRYEYTVQNWARIIETTAFHSVFIRTFLYSIFVTISCVILGIPYAYLLVRTDNQLLRYLLLFGLFVPFFSGVIIRAYGWLILLGRNGVFNWFVQVAGFSPLDIIGTPTAVVVGLVQYMLPFAVLMLTPAIAGISPDLERAAKNCGANQVDTFRYVILPLARPGITAAIIVVFTITMANYSIPDILGGGTNDFVANFIHSKVFGTLNYPFASVLSLVLVFVASTVVLAIFRRYGTGTLGIEVADS